MKKKNTYSPVKGCQTRDFFGTFSKLWLADDHLLLVIKNGWKETYRKFYFQDIQALVLAKTKQRRNLNITLLFIILFFLVLAGLSGKAGAFFFLSIASAFLIVLVVSWLKGPTCTAQIITAVQTTSLPCKRLPVAQRLQEKLTASIEKIQGIFTAEHGEKIERKLQEITAADRIKQTTKEPEKLEEFSPFFNNQAHLVTYLLFLLLAIVSAVSLGGRGTLLYSLENVSYLLTLTAVTIALYHQSKSKIKGILTNLTWLSSAWLVLSILANFGLFFVAMSLAADIRAMPSNEYEVWMMLGKVQPADSLYLRILLITKTVSFTLLGGFGLLFSSRAGGASADA